MNLAFRLSSEHACCIVNIFCVSCVCTCMVKYRRKVCTILCAFIHNYIHPLVRVFINLTQIIMQYSLCCYLSELVHMYMHCTCMCGTVYCTCMCGAVYCTHVRLYVFIGSHRFMLSCSGYPNCRAVQFFPGCIASVAVDQSLCDSVSREHHP